jgi:proteasome assembly chaperone (PAC2) family protein
MEHVTWTARPRLRTPVLLSAFSGWNDAADAATVALRYLVDGWGARPFASIDPEEFYDFSTTRPQVRLTNGINRDIVWPSNEFYAGSLPGGQYDVVLMLGTEPQLKWRTYCRQVLGVAESLRCRMVVTLGALLADVPHSRPVSIIGTATDSAMIDRFELQRSRYEGPTGIVGALHDACGKAGVPSASLWAAMPAYVPGTSSPKGALALVDRASRLVEGRIDTTPLAIAARQYEAEVDELVAGDDDLRSYVSRLEHSFDLGGFDDGEDDDDDEQEDAEPMLADEEVAPAAEQLVDELERFLRDRPEET